MILFFYNDDQTPWSHKRGRLIFLQETFRITNYEDELSKANLGLDHPLTIRFFVNQYAGKARMPPSVVLIM